MFDIADTKKRARRCFRYARDRSIVQRNAFQAGQWINPACQDLPGRLLPAVGVDGRSVVDLVDAGYATGADDPQEEPLRQQDGRPLAIKINRFPRIVLTGSGDRLL
ncbi:hypothetical protein FP026_07555 [Rhizobium tropici]|uniref:Uncharacterized protein n=1 Tax=Rhizobium tropici TaxID=398 RepID=A0A5B0WDA5_RHITR|nr:hypothetical protein [Rhizobium tropici]KAA1183869.1 hypothetical protein FP026_07555 [Rhizobium tropici]